MERYFWLSSEPIEIKINGLFIENGHYILNRPVEDEILIEHMESGKRVAYIIVNPVIIENDYVEMLTGMKFSKGHCYKKYRRELEDSLNNYFEGKLTNPYGKQNFTIGEFYCGYYRCTDSNKIKPKMVKILKENPTLFANVEGNNLYKYENTLFELIITKKHDNKSSLEAIKSMMKDNDDGYDCEKEKIYLVGIEGFYNSIGVLL